MKIKQLPNILYIVSRYPWPLDSGIHIRQYNILFLLKKFGNIDLLVLPPKLTEVPNEIRKLCRNIFVYPRNHVNNKFENTTFNRLIRIFRELNGWPLDDSPLKKGVFPSEIANVLKKDYDLIWFEKLNQALRIRHAGGINAVLDLDDIEHLKISRMAQLVRNPLKRLRLLIYARAWRISEIKALNQYARVITCSEKDKRYLGNSNNIAIVPNGFQVNYDVKFTQGIAGQMLFVGNMEYKPNDDAVCFFINEILPKIKYQIPQTHLIVVGANPSKKLRDLVDGNIVKLLGKVDTVASYLKESALSVVPLRIGGGTRLKILESLANKTPVVSTTIGAEGLELEHGKHILIADEPQAFADYCISLLKNRELRKQLAEDGFNQVARKYSWDNISESVKNVVHSLYFSRH